MLLEDEATAKHVRACIRAAPAVIKLSPAPLLSPSFLNSLNLNSRSPKFTGDDIMV
jgi:hypothetical protein